MKDYLRNSERSQLLYFKKYVDIVDKILGSWKDNLTKEEIKALKTARTWGVKAYESILSRQNDTTIKTFYNSLKESFIQLSDRFTINMYKKKIKSALDASYEENGDYFRLVELIMEKNCLECKLHGAECEIYQEFEAHCVPSPTGEKEHNCKYAYVKDTLEDIIKNKRGA
jgi:hypothetical protein